MGSQTETYCHVASAFDFIQKDINLDYLEPINCDDLIFNSTFICVKDFTIEEDDDLEMKRGDLIGFHEFVDDKQEWAFGFNLSKEDFDDKNTRGMYPCNFTKVMDKLIVTAQNYSLTQSPLSSPPANNLSVSPIPNNPGKSPSPTFKT